MVKLLRDLPFRRLQGTISGLLGSVLTREKSDYSNRTGSKARQLAILLGILAAAKVATFLPLFLFSDISRAGFLSELGTKWDSDFYVKIAQLGYNAASNPGTDNAYAFSPVLPSMIAAVKLMTGSYWTVGLLIVNIFSFLFPVVIFKLSDFKTALITALFPVYLVFSTLTYADDITLFFLALSLFFLLRRKNYFFSGLSLALAILTSYAVILTVPIFVAKILIDDDRKLGVYRYASAKFKDLTRFLSPVVACAILIAAFFFFETGSLWTFFSVEKNAGWGVGLVTPLAQDHFLLYGWFTGFHWTVMGIYLPPIYWLLRNLAFEAFYVVGVVLLLVLIRKNRISNGLFLVGFALSIMIPLFFLDGVAAGSIPRLLLPAFPIFLGYSRGLLKDRNSIIVYCALCLVIAPLIALVQLDALFA